MIDILTTPSMSKPKQDYSRTPGQVLSLISSFGFVSVQNNIFCIVYNIIYNIKIYKCKSVSQHFYLLTRIKIILI